MSSSMAPASTLSHPAPMSVNSLLHQTNISPHYPPHHSYVQDHYNYIPQQNQSHGQSDLRNAPSQAPSTSEYEYGYGNEYAAYEPRRRPGASMMNNAPYQYRAGYTSTYSTQEQSAPSSSYSNRGGHYMDHAAVEQYPPHSYSHSAAYSPPGHSSSHIDSYAVPPYSAPPHHHSHLPPPASPQYQRQEDYRRPETYHRQDEYQYQEEYQMSRRQASTSIVDTVRADYQPSDRVSVRLAARRTTPPDQPSSVPGPSSARQKRPAPAGQDDGGHTPAKKKRKAGKATSAAVSRRGFTAQKRLESAANAQWNASLVSLEVDRLRVEGSLESNIDGDRYTVEIQVKRCMTSKSADQPVPKCLSCTRRWAGDTCRFQGIRYFFKDTEGKIRGVGFKGNSEPAKLDYPEKWNVPPTEENLTRVKLSVASALLPILREELEHLKKPLIVRRKRESDVRATCDTCNTSIFSAGWMCRNCGREACPHCFEKVKRMTESLDDLPADEQKEWSQKRDNFANKQPFFLNCSKRADHNIRDFCPVTRFEEDELVGAIEGMEQMLSASTAEGALPATVSSLSEVSRAAPPGPSHRTSSTGKPSAYSTPYYNITRLAYEDLTEGTMRSYLMRGEPLIVTGLDHRMQLAWTPEYFIEHYGDRSCLITNCVDETNKQITVKEFFETFGRYNERDQVVWKLKDWPPMADFKTSFPELYKDFMDAVPIPSYIRRDGVMNISSHFPKNTIAPDLGPKMYNAQASTICAGSKGSTRLHMDMADALNIMTYSARQAGETVPAGAAWDIFRPEDSAAIRDFMRGTLHRTSSDPIHSQHHYLDEKLRHELYEATGVCAYNFQQQPGEAVVIPAGCAHQVSNLSDCIKVAVDFVSPENVHRCERLTDEFRKENTGTYQKQWKDDVLQLKTMMWFAWVNCCRQEDKLRKR
ncbi:hypothetical protein BD626DRAFT_482072 [Schizophyllum amplum]|uniref:JmjC domain-containing protein n=1 Tax=Schizophyllum amplum TaxID=97359 RepID=A0A550CUS3_9AGAR|nr:hypothetical protein BD626DRAFT_482072 [Auriculariopsis ampla]